MEIYSSVHFIASSKQSDALFYLGASMTLVGMLPPLCDNGNMLVDGGYGEFCVEAQDRT
jgi:hypothetical protein